MPYETRTISVAEGARLLVFSDGILEIEKADGAMWPFAEFLNLESELAIDGDLIGRHLDYIRELGGKEVLADDFSMMDIRF